MKTRHDSHNCVCARYLCAVCVCALSVMICLQAHIKSVQNGITPPDRPAVRNDDRKKKTPSINQQYHKTKM